MQIDVLSHLSYASISTNLQLIKRLIPISGLEIRSSKFNLNSTPVFKDTEN